MQIPVKLFVNKNLMPNENTISKLIKMSTVDGVCNKIVALPDVHYKFNTYFRFSIPTGTVALCKDAIIPKFINPDCGMLILTTNLNNLSENDVDKVFKSLKSKVSISMRKTR